MTLSNDRNRNLKQKISYSLLAILVVIVLYTGLRLCFGFFTPYNPLTARHDIINGKIQIIAIGLPNMPIDRQRLAKQYGFNFHYVGCNATTELLNGSKYYNNVVKEYLTAKYGKDFWTKFNSQLDSVENLNKTVLLYKSEAGCSFEGILSDPKTPKLARELFNNTAKNSDEPLSYFNNIYSKDRQKRDFYFRVITNSYKIADGAYSEGLGNFGKEYIENNPKDFVTFFDNKECFTDDDLKIWAKIALLEFQIIDENIETGKGESLVNLYSKKLIKDSGNYSENQKETIKKFTDYLKTEWGNFLKNI